MMMSMNLNRRAFLGRALTAGGLIAATPAMLEALLSGEGLIPSAHAGIFKNRDIDRIRESDPGYLVSDYWSNIGWREGANQLLSSEGEIADYIRKSLGWGQRLTDSFLALGQSFVQASGSLLRFMLPPVMLKGLGLGWSILSYAAQVTPNLLFKGGQFAVDIISDLGEAVQDCVLPCIREGAEKAFTILGNSLRAASSVIKFLENGRGANSELRRTLFPSQDGEQDAWTPEESNLRIEGVFHPSLENGCGIFVSRESYKVDLVEYMIIGTRYSPTTAQTYFLATS